MAPSFSAVAAQLDQRRTDVRQATEIAGGVYRFSAYLVIDNPGEAKQSLTFPVLFTEKPVFFWGAEVNAGSKIADGAYPMAIPIVAGWRQRPNDDTGNRWYLGCNIAVVSTGVDLQTLLIGCHFEGKAVRQPIGVA